MSNATEKDSVGIFKKILYNIFTKIKTDSFQMPDTIMTHNFSNIIL